MMIDIYNRETDSIYKLLCLKPGDYPDLDTSIAGELTKRTDELMFYIQDLKIEMIKYIDGSETPAIEDRSIKYDKINKTDDITIPSQLLIGSEDDGKAFALRRLLIDYKKYIASVTHDPVLKGKMDRLLNTDDAYNAEKDEYLRWEYLNFHVKDMAFTLITLTQFQQNIKYCESEVMSYLYNKMLSELNKAAQDEQHKSIRK